MIKKTLLGIAQLFTAVVHAHAPLPEIDRALQPYIDAGDLPGIVTIVARKDKVLHVNCLGWQDMEQGRKMSPGTVFWIASQSKPITATAVMMLVEEGRIDLDLPITEYIPELKNLFGIVEDDAERQVLSKQVKPMTLRLLLSHSSGMQWVANPQNAAGKIDIMPFSVSVYASATTPLLFQPGEGYKYSNQGINIAATVVERVSGIPFDRFLDTRIFGPLGMTSATFWPGGDLSDRMAVPYKKDKSGALVATRFGQLQYPLDDRTKRYAEAAGGLFCSAEDLAKFYQMIACGGVWEGRRLLSEASIEEMGRKQSGPDVENRYGLGWNNFVDGMAHGGSMGTFSRVYMNEGYVVMYFIQQQNLPKHKEAFDLFNKTVKSVYDLTGKSTGKVQ